MMPSPPTPATSPISLVTSSITNPGGPVENIEYLMFEEVGGFVTVLSPQAARRESQRVSAGGRPFREIAEGLDPRARQVQVVPASLLPGEYHPRVWRNGIGSRAIHFMEAGSFKPADIDELRQRVVALHRIQRQLASVFEVVTPTQAQRGVMGEAIGQILALAAFEVERLLREAYVANSPPHRIAGRRLSMNDFHALLQPMHLADWGASLEYYEDWGEVRPFSGWTAAAVPGWWTAYNRRKHDPGNATSANLESAIACVLAVRVVLEAEFGPIVGRLLPDEGIAAIRVTARPVWRPEELYFPPTQSHVDGAFRDRLLFP